MKDERQWRLIDSGESAAAFNMALDEAIATAVRRGDSPATLRLYGWDRPSLSLGCFQKTSDINIRYCGDSDIPVVRRLTGGRAVFHESELTYSFSVNILGGLFSKGLADSYRKIGTALSLAFRKIGLDPVLKDIRERGRISERSPLCFKSSSAGEILIDGRKVAGSAQRRWRDGLIQQGSVPYHYDEEMLRAVFGQKEASSMKECMVGLREILPVLTVEDLKRAVIISFEETFGASMVSSGPTEEEYLLARGLEGRKYLQKWWTHRK